MKYWMSRLLSFARRTTLDPGESALAGLLGNEKLRQALGQRARQAVQRYSWTERAKRSLDEFIV